MFNFEPSTSRFTRKADLEGLSYMERLFVEGGVNRDNYKRDNSKQMFNTVGDASRYPNTGDLGAHGKIDHETSEEAHQSKGKATKTTPSASTRLPSSYPSLHHPWPLSRPTKVRYSRRSSAVKTNPVSLGFPPFPTPGEWVSAGRAIPTGVTMRFRTLTVDTSTSGRGKGILSKDTTFGWCGVGETVATLTLICCGGGGGWKKGLVFD